MFQDSQISESNIRRFESLGVADDVGSYHMPSVRILLDKTMNNIHEIREILRIRYPFHGIMDTFQFSFKKLSLTTFTFKHRTKCKSTGHAVTF